MAAAAAHAGRAIASWRHTLQLWAAFGDTRERAVATIGPILERCYGIGFERFERYTPCGRPDDIAAALEPYLESGCRRFNIVPAAEDLPAALAGIAEVKRLLDGRLAYH